MFDEVQLAAEHGSYIEVPWNKAHEVANPSLVRMYTISYVQTLPGVSEGNGPMIQWKRCCSDMAVSLFWIHKVLEELISFEPVICLESISTPKSTSFLAPSALQWRKGVVRRPITWMKGFYIITFGDMCCIGAKCYFWAIQGNMGTESVNSKRIKKHCHKCILADSWGSEVNSYSEFRTVILRLRTYCSHGFTHKACTTIWWETGELPSHPLQKTAKANNYKKSCRKTRMSDGKRITFLP